MVNEKYELWCKKATGDSDLVKELESIRDNEDAISDAFYKDLEFGTGGLRGVIGAGTNRMNIYTVGKASQGLAAYVNSVSDNGSIAVAYDSRIKSDLFAKTAASIFAANGIKVYIYKELMPTPMLSFAVRRLKCDAGVVVTASHNPAKYNGYKAYGPDGCQLGLEAADYVLSIMNKVDIFDDVKTTDFEKAVADGKIEYIGDERGRVRQMKLQKMELGEPDASGRRSPVPVPGAIETIDVDEVIVSVGVSPNPLVPNAIDGLEVTPKGTIVVNADTLQSSIPDIYAGGDIVRGGATVILAMGDGRRAAAAMHEALQKQQGA